VFVFLITPLADNKIFVVIGKDNPELVATRLKFQIVLGYPKILYGWLVKLIITL
jgi:hypothetical protein